MCVSCGSIGIDDESRLISCSQCGQSYHPYCVGFTKVISRKRKRFNDLIGFVFSCRTFFSIVVGVVLNALSANVVARVPTKENFFSVMIVISPTIHIVFNLRSIKCRKAIGNVNGVCVVLNVVQPVQESIVNGKIITLNVVNVIRWIPVHYVFEIIV